MLDFNDAPTSNTRKAAGDGTDANREKSEIRTALNDHLALLVVDIWPSGKRRQNKYLVGDVMGGPGDSLELLLSGPKAGLWTDRATGEGGDIFDLIARYYSLNVQTQFPQVLEKAREWLGRVSAMPPSAVAASKAKAPVVDELGPPTAKWDYQDASGKLIAVVYRHDPEPGRKEFRPWDVRRRKMTPPEPRPLYNQPGMLKADQVVLVEGEKCAQALLEFGVCATSELHTLQKAWIKAGGKWSTFIIWAKNTFTLGRADYQRQYEPILYGWKQGTDHFWCGDRDQSDIWNYNKPRVNDLHPTMKPVELVERAIKNSSKSRDIVLDLFGGSGTTLIASEKTGRQARLIELDPKFVDVIIKRWEEYTGQQAVREDDGVLFINAATSKNAEPVAQ